MLLSLLCSSVFFLAVLASPAHAQEPQADVGKGSEVYTMHCVGCHGIQGKGDGPDAAKLIVPPANFHKPESRAKTEFELRSQIIWGIAFSPMHDWWDKLSVEEIHAVTAHIRRLAPYAPSTP